VLLVVDQAEQLVAPGAPGDDFFRELGTALKKHDGLRLLWLCRADSAAALARLLAERGMASAELAVTPPTLAELRQIVSGPAARKSIFYESPALVEEIAEAVEGQPGALPLLSTFLSELYGTFVSSNPTDRIIRFSHYRNVGLPRDEGGQLAARRDDGSANPVERLLFRLAAQTYDDLCSNRPASAALMRRLFVRMYDYDENHKGMVSGVAADDLIYPRSGLPLYSGGRTPRGVSERLVERALQAWVEKRAALKTLRDRPAPPDADRAAPFPDPSLEALAAAEE
jgi:hypothetical protein